MRQPPAPAAPSGGSPNVAVPGVAGGTPQPLPQTAAEIARLRAKGRELSSQLNSVTDRRDDVLSELRDATSDARPGLEARLKVLDDRVVSLEQEIATNSRAIANSPLELVQRAEASTTVARSDPGPDIVIPVVTALCFLPLIIGYTVRMLRRSRVPAAAPPRDRQQEERFARMEQAIDAMAIEIERMTEGQRYLTRVLTDTPGALGPGAASPVAVPRGAPEPVAASRAAPAEG